RALLTLDLCRVLFRPDHDEVVVHNESAIEHLALGHVLLLQLGRVSKRHVGLATSSKRERLAGAHRDRLHRVSGLSLEHWDQDIEEPRVLGARGGGQDDSGRLLGLYWQREDQHGDQRDRRYPRRTTARGAA